MCVEWSANGFVVSALLSFQLAGVQQCNEITNTLQRSLHHGFRRPFCHGSV